MANIPAQIRTFLDVSFVAGLVFALFLGGKIMPFLIVAGVIPMFFLWKDLRKRTLAVPLSRILLPFGAYFTYSILAYLLYSGLGPDDPHPINPSLELYFIAIAMLVVGLVRGLEVQNLSRLLRHVTPWALIVSFVVLSVLMFAEIRDGCRVRGIAPWPFIPALLFTTLTFLSLVGWREFSSRERALRLLLLSLSFVVVNVYTGSRGVGVAQLVILFTLFVLGFPARFRGQLPGWRQILLVTAGGVLLSGLVGIATGCGPLNRNALILDTATILARDVTQPSAENTAPMQEELKPDTAPSPLASEEVFEEKEDKLAQIKKADESIGLRLQMWKTSVHAIMEKPFFGHGALYLQKLITSEYGFEHNHNQFLSWLVTGGGVALILGMGFLAIPWFVSVGLDLSDRILFFISVSALWSLAMMFDSFFNLKFYTHYYCLLCGVLYAWVNDIRRNRDLQ